MRMGRVQILSASLLFCGLTGCTQSPATWWASVNGKAHELGELEANYHALQSEHERLKKDYFRLENETMEMRAQLESTQKGDRNLAATGSLEGRTPSSISYEVPKGLHAEEALALAYEHFTEQRFAQAAATFEDLFQRADAGSTVDASARYTAGVAWFQLGNYKRARRYFEEAMNVASGEQREKIHKKVELWLRAIDRKGGGVDGRFPEREGAGGTLGG